LLTIVALTLNGRSLTPAPATAPVTRQDFSDVLVEAGVISSQNLRLYSSSLTGLPATLTYLAPEGAPVSPGDALARFDVSAFTAARDRAVLALREAESNVDRAAAEVQLDQLQSTADSEAAEQQTENARRALANQQSGKGAVDRAAAELAIGDATREVSRAATTYDSMKPLLAEGFVTRAELDRAEQSLRHAEDQQRLAIARREALVLYESPAGLSRAETDLRAASATAIRQRDAAAARARTRQAALDIAASQVDQLRENISALTAQIAHGTILADVSGLVIYRTIYFGAELRKPQIGDDIAAGQAIVGVPDLAKLTVDTRIRETDLHRLSSAAPVTVHVDAYPDLALAATVGVIGAVAETDAAHAGAKFFPVTILIQSPDARLRSGMTARVDIRVNAMSDVLTVPAASVFFDGARRYVLVSRSGSIEHRDVTVAAEDDALAVIARGVVEHERVLLALPERGPR
jgi:multidrug resistance efflux pump